MKIQTLIAHLTEIAKYQPDAVVYVETGCIPMNMCPITNIESQVSGRKGLAEIYLGASYFDEQPFDINKFK